MRTHECTLISKMFYKIIMFLVFSLLNMVASNSSSSSIPTKEEQTSVLLNVQEVFQQIKDLVNDEGIKTNQAVVSDVEKMVGRALDHLALAEDLAMTRLNCVKSKNSACTQILKPQIQRTVKNCRLQLDKCVKETSGTIADTSIFVTNATRSAILQGESMLNTLSKCSKHGGFQQLACYRRVMKQDVSPLKNLMLQAINRHKEGHLTVIEVRDRANDCIDTALRGCQKEIAKYMAEALNCD